MAEEPSTPEKDASLEVEKDDVELVRQAKKKLVMDFGLGQSRPTRVNIEVLKDMIRTDPDKLGRALSKWMQGGG